MPGADAMRYEIKTPPVGRRFVFILSAALYAFFAFARFLWRRRVLITIISTRMTAAAQIITTRVMSAGRSTARSSKSPAPTSKQR